MSREIKERMRNLFKGVDSNLNITDPEWVDIVEEFSQKETVSVNKLTEKEQMLCILSTLLFQIIHSLSIGGHFYNIGGC